MPRKSKKASVAVQVEASNLIRDLVMLLLRLEWIGDGEGNRFCHVCLQLEERGHDCCKLEEALIRSGGKDA